MYIERRDARPHPPIELVMSKSFTLSTKHATIIGTNLRKHIEKIALMTAFGENYQLCSLFWGGESLYCLYMCDTQQNIDWMGSLTLSFA